MLGEGEGAKFTKIYVSAPKLFQNGRKGVGWGLMGVLIELYLEVNSYLSADLLTGCKFCKHAKSAPECKFEHVNANAYIQM